jgi:DNA topoisomerase-1
MDAYCVKCKTKQEIINPTAGYNAAGTPVTTGVCGVCGTKLYRMGRTPAHESLPKPDIKKAREPKKNGKLVIVESPAKAKTVGRFLGRGYTVKASVGHVRDLLRSELSVDVDHDFNPKYRIPNEKRPIVKEIKELVKKSEEVYLATDPDREGEAIAWHLMEAAEISPENSKRVVFHEITQKAIEEAFSHPREVDMNLVDAQQARRILDRLVGYNLSPLLWEKVRSRLSAGRVQSVALRLIVEREREIDHFNPVEYWTIGGEFRQQGHKTSYLARLIKADDEDVSLPDENAVKPLAADVVKAEYKINRIKKGERRRKPSAPFITSTLQQEASRKLGYTARRTMALAQQLYEGLDVGEGGTTGLITYMRTDSTNISEMAQGEARTYISQRFGHDFLPASTPQYKTKVVGAQEAHEAIRPTSIQREPDKIKNLLTRDQYRLYQLIWQRFLASQMESAVYDTLTVDITGNSPEHAYLFRTSGSTVRFPGFMVVYEEALDEDYRPEEGEENNKIPAGLLEGANQDLLKPLPEQHFTQPPPRFTEATLVQALEQYGIGRPSTYAPILSTIQERGYVTREAKRLIPTETGLLVNDLIVSHFSDIVDLGFTAKMESELDQVADGEAKWVEVIRGFYGPFSEEILKAQAEMPVTKTEPEKVGRACPDCGHDLIIRWGRFGKFISCSNFPTCRHTEPILTKIGVTCPKDGGEIVERKTRRGRVFYGCANYPECDFTSWKKPLTTKCPSCGGMLVISSKKEAQCLICESIFPLDDVLENVLPDSAVNESKTKTA